MKMNMIKTSTLLTDAEKLANLNLIDGVLNPVTKQEEAFKMFMEGKSDPIKMD